MNTKLITAIAAIAIILSAFSCTPYKLKKTTKNKFPVSNNQEIKLYYFDKPDKKYTIIGTLEIDKIADYGIIEISRDSHYSESITKSKIAKFGGDGLLNIKETYEKIYGDIIKFTTENE
jgi:hypothetical protein